MANLGKTYSAEGHEGKSFEPIPAGWYVAVIQESEMKVTKNGKGQYLQLSFKIIDGKHSGRIVWDRLNLYNENPAAVEIAEQALLDIMSAAGKMQASDSQELHGIPLEIKLKVREETGDFDASNEIKGYRPASGAPRMPSAPSMPRAAATAKQAGPAPPWQR